MERAGAFRIRRSLRRDVALLGEFDIGAVYSGC